MAADTARFRELLLAEKARILRAAQRTLTEDMTLDQDDLADEVDLATADYNQALAFRMRGRERHLLDKIDEAMERLDEGEYFWCADCGESIGVRRLLARPVTTLCIRCKEREEHRERGFAR
ncbi:MAG: TraR/DksA C4-type zinc finger protein [Myxococcales bacterium]|nr:TraR/DksA C4-type zinc finger protein [Myxococcales bacterium]